MKPGTELWQGRPEFHCFLSELWTQSNLGFRFGGNGDAARPLNSRRSFIASMKPNRFPVPAQKIPCSVGIISVFP